MKRRLWRFFAFIVFLVGSPAALVTWAVRADARQTERNIALAEALRTGDLRVVRRLITEGADPNVREDFKHTAEPFLDRLKRILRRRGPRNNGTGKAALHVAAAYRDEGLMRLLLSRGAEVDARWGDVIKETPLMLASNAYETFQMIFPDSGEWKTLPPPSRAQITMLLESGADPNARHGFEGNTAYRNAIWIEDYEIDRLFLKHGAKWNIKNRFDTTCFYDAVGAGRIELARRMLAEGADPNEASNRGNYTALMSAVYKGDLRMARMLLDAGAKVDDTYRSYSALYLAVEDKAPLETVQLLLDYGARPDQKAWNDSTPLSLARTRGNPKLIAMLEAAVLAVGLTKEDVVPDRDIDLALQRSKKFRADPARHRHEE